LPTPTLPVHRRRTIVADLVCSLRPKILERGVSTEREREDLDGAVRTHAADPRTVMFPVLCFTAWGRMPGPQRFAVDQAV
jgi:hypothetical protein